MGDLLGPIISGLFQLGGAGLSQAQIAEENRISEAFMREGVGTLDPLANFDVGNFVNQQVPGFEFGGVRFGSGGFGGAGPTREDFGSGGGGIGRTRIGRTGTGTTTLTREDFGSGGGGIARNRIGRTINQAGGNFLNLDDLFASTTDFDALRSGVRGDLRSGASDALGAIGRTRGEIGGRFQADRDFLTGQMVDPSDVAAEIGGFLPTGKFEETLRAALQEIGAGSRARLNTANQGLIARELSRGGSLESAQSALQGLSFGEGQSRALEAGQARADTEQLINERDVSRAGLQSEGFLGQLDANTLLSQLISGTFGEEAGLLSELGIEEADISGQLGQDLARALGDIGFFQDEREASGQKFAGAAGLDLIGMRGRAGEFGTGIQTNAITGQANLFAGHPADRLFRDFGQDVANVGINFGDALLADSLSSPEQKSSFGASIEGTGFTTGCVDADAMVEVQHRGKLALREVLPGDEVMGEDGEYHLVIGKDCGTVPKDQQGDHVRIVTNYGRSLVLTADHAIAGRPAGEWNVGDTITNGERTEKIVKAEPHDYVVSGDLMLQGNVRYVANGFPVDSNIGSNGHRAWYKYLTKMGAMEANGFVHDLRNPIGGWALAA